MRHSVCMQLCAPGVHRDLQNLKGPSARVLGFRPQTRESEGFSLPKALIVCLLNPQALGPLGKIT